MEKNVALPGDLLTAVADMAQTQGKTPDQLIEAATREYLARKEWDRVTRPIARRARELGITEDDVVDLIHEWRREQRAIRDDGNARQ